MHCKQSTMRGSIPSRSSPREVASGTCSSSTLGVLRESPMPAARRLTQPEPRNHVSEHTHDILDAVPGSWEHFTSIAPPWFDLWTTYRPDVMMDT